MAKLEEMSAQEKQEAFDKWLKSKGERKVKGTAKRQAQKALIEAHKDEFLGLIKKFEGKPAAPKAVK